MFFFCTYAQVFDVFGPVKQPIYAVRFSTQEELAEAKVRRCRRCRLAGCRAQHLSAHLTWRAGLFFFFLLQIAVGEEICFAETDKREITVRVLTSLLEK